MSKANDPHGSAKPHGGVATQEQKKEASRLAGWTGYESGILDIIVERDRLRSHFAALRDGPVTTNAALEDLKALIARAEAAERALRGLYRAGTWHCENPTIGADAERMLWEAAKAVLGDTRYAPNVTETEIAAAFSRGQMAAMGGHDFALRRVNDDLSAAKARVDYLKELLDATRVCGNRLAEYCCHLDGTATFDAVRCWNEAVEDMRAALAATDTGKDGDK